MEEEYNIDECPSLMSEDIGVNDINKYDAWVNGNDVVFQFTIHAEDVTDDW